MKYIVLKTILPALCLLACIVGCRKTGDEANPFADVKNLGVGTYLVLDKEINLNLDFADLSNTSGAITVHTYPGGEEADKIQLFASPDNSTDVSVWSQIKEVPYTGAGTELKVTATELATALGVPPSGLEAGTSYTIFTRVITKSGKKYDYSNANDDGGGGLITGPAYKSVFYFQLTIVCPFTGSMTGTYKVLRDDWADWSEGDMVQVTDGPGANQIDLSAVWPNPAYGSIVNPLIVDIDPASGTATVPEVVFGEYSVEYTAEGAGDGGVAGYVFSCTGYITLNINIDGDPYRLILQKQ